MILSTRDGAWLGERRAPEGELRALVMGCDLPEAGGPTIVALSSGGDLLAFDGATTGSVVAGEGRLHLQELARRVALGAPFPAQVAQELSQANYEESALAQFVLAKARLAERDAKRALQAADAAIARAGKHPDALALRARALVMGVQVVDKETWKLVREALAPLVTDRPELAADTALDLAEGMAAETQNLETARRLVQLVTHVAPTVPRARRLRITLMLRQIGAPPADGKPEDLEKSKREVLWLREDVLIALTAPDLAEDPKLRELAALSAYLVNDKLEFHRHCAHVHSDLVEELAKLSDAFDRDAVPDPAVFDRIANKRPEWKAFVSLLKRVVADGASNR